MPACCETDDCHSGGYSSRHTMGAVLDHEAAVRLRMHLLRSEQEQVRRGLAPGHHRRGEEVGTEETREPRELERAPDALGIAGRRHTARHTYRGDHLGDAVYGLELGFEDLGEALGLVVHEGRWQDAIPLVLDERAHLRVGEADISGRDLLSCHGDSHFAQQLGLHPAREHFAVDQDAVAVEDHYHRRVTAHDELPHGSASRGARSTRSANRRRPSIASGERRHGETTRRVTPRSVQRRTSSALDTGPPRQIWNGVSSRPYSRRSPCKRSICPAADSNVWPMPIQPSPTRAARRSAAPLSPPTRIGGHGFCTGLGSNATASKRKNSPSCATSACVHNRLHTSRASSTRRPRDSKSRPIARHSSASQLAPIPNSSRPPDRTSTVCTARAEMNGWRSPRL